MWKERLRNIFFTIKNVLYEVLIWASAADTNVLNSEECERSEHIKHASIGSD